MKSKIKYLALTLLLSSTVLGACTSAPVNSSTPTPTASSSAAANPTDTQTQASLQVNVERINEKAYNNKSFSQELQASPNAVLSAEGLKLEANEKIKVVDFLNEAGKVYLILDDRNLERFYGEQLKNSSAEAEADATVKLFRGIRAKAESDAAFKARLLADSATVLTEEGVNAEAAKNMEVLDYEAGTHFFLLLEPGQEISRGPLEVITNHPAINTAVGFLRTTLKGLTSDPINEVKKYFYALRSGAEKGAYLANQASAPALEFALNASTDGVYFGFEAACFVPRIFGASCGYSKEVIRNSLIELL